MDDEEVESTARDVMSQHVGQVITDALFENIEKDLAEGTGLPALCDRRCNPPTMTSLGEVQALVFLPDGEFIRVLLSDRREL